MLRLSLALLMNACLVFTLVMSGCNQPKKEPTEYQDPYASYNDPYSSGSSASASRGTATDPYAGATPPATDSSWTSQTDPYAPGTGVMSASGQRTHTVAKGDTLYSLARKYYSDQARWRDIYNANRDKISNPDVIKAGQKLAIP